MSDMVPPKIGEPDRRAVIGALGLAAVAGAAALWGADAAPPGAVAVPVPSDDLARTVETALTTTARRSPLDPYVVLSSAPRRPVLYTWTTAEQIQALRAGGDLLVRTHSPRHGRSRFDQGIANDDHWMAERLRALPYRRFAWTAPWATLMGWLGEQYGDRLIRVELRPEVWLGALSVRPTGARRWTFFDGDGRLEEARVGDAAKVGAVYHENVSDAPHGPMGTFMEYGRTFREYVLFDPAAIARWSHGDARCIAALEADLKMVAALRARPPEVKSLGGLESHWGRRPRTAAARYMAALNWNNPAYQPSRLNLDRIHTRLTQALAVQGPPING